MKPYILDLREERCPMALLRAKKTCTNLRGDEFIIHIRDSNSMNDIVQFFDKQRISVFIEKKQYHYVLTVNSKRAYLDV